MNLETTHDAVESVKHAAHDVSVKAQELEKSAEESLIKAEKIGKNSIKTNVRISLISLNSHSGEQKLGETAAWLGEKGSEAMAKGSEILDATQQALATGAAVVTEKVKQGVEVVADAASSAKATTEQLATDAKAKASAAADVVATKTVEAFEATKSGAQTAAEVVQGRKKLPSFTFN